jgi:hypothetical protein
VILGVRKRNSVQLLLIFFLFSDQDQKRIRHLIEPHEVSKSHFLFLESTYLGQCRQGFIFSYQENLNVTNCIVFLFSRSGMSLTKEKLLP